jgi:hypothetical protein
MSFFKAFFVRAALALGLLCASGQLLATPYYHVTVDTKDLAGTSGYLDFLNLNLGSAAAAQATVTNFVGDFGPDSFTFGDDVSQPSAGTAVIGNHGGYNEFAQWADFGGLLQFDVSFGVSGTGAGTDLTVALLDDQGFYLPNPGDLVVFSLMPGEQAAVNVVNSIADVNKVPEPGSLAQVGAGFLLLLGAIRRRR